MSNQKFGPTGRHPFGAIRPDDDGELAIGIASDRENGTVIINFGVSLSWIGLYPAQAKAMAEIMINHADELLKGAQ